MTLGTATPPTTSRAPPRPPELDPSEAWQPYRPGPQRPWNLARAAHLYRRAAFGARWDQLQRALGEGPERAVTRLLRPEADVAGFDRTHDRYEASAADSASADALRAWWLRRMIDTPHPLQEKMTLFWHDYFAASNVQVRDARPMQQHVALLRQHALGRFAPLLRTIARDPATLISANALTNRRSQPDASFARILLQQYTVGGEHCSAKDIQEAGRAFTGRFIVRREFREIPREHDPGVKAVLGERGAWNGDDVVAILLQQPETPRRLVRKLYHWLISETDEPQDALLAPVVESLARDWDVGRAVETMLRSNLFFSPAAHRRRVKSPVDFALGIVIALEGTVSTTRLGRDLAGLGQGLYSPPTFKGWAGGRAWINRATLVGRSNLARALLSSTGAYGGKLDPQAVAARHGHPSPDSAARFLVDALLQEGDEESFASRAVQELAVASRPPARGEAGTWLRQSAHVLATLPESQLA